MGGASLAPFLLRRNTPPLTPPSVFPLCHSVRQVRARVRPLKQVCPACPMMLPSLARLSRKVRSTPSRGRSTEVC